MCVITIFRIAIAGQFDVHDFPYHLVRIAIATDLEPILGIIISCIPLFPPAIKAICKSKRTPISHIPASNSRAKSSFIHSPEGSHFHRLNSSFLLTEVESNAVNVCGGVPKTEHWTPDENCSGTEQGRTDKRSIIKIQKGWEIRSQSLPSECQWQSHGPGVVHVNSL